jgi:hypothetical protein
MLVCRYNLTLSQHIAIFLCENFNSLNETSLGKIYNEACVDKIDAEKRRLQKEREKETLFIERLLNAKGMSSDKYDRIIKEIKNNRFDKKQKQRLFAIAFIVRENVAAKQLCDANSDAIGKMRHMITELSAEKDRMLGRTQERGFFRSTVNISFGRAMDLYFSIFKYYGEIDKVKLEKIEEYIKQGLSDSKITEKMRFY